jgi:hypothetical protein
MALKGFPFYLTKIWAESALNFLEAEKESISKTASAQKICLAKNYWTSTLLLPNVKLDSYYAIYMTFILCKIWHFLVQQFEGPFYVVRSFGISQMVWTTVYLKAIIKQSSKMAFW